ncbi:hypothetical protein DYD21_10555 [Rhodohalobacter sp. SW132]|uniref:hypothetical protein n=1 Tax=Rhodohalobacter sp. SW132 TaxID=2293433 RepID=UPI000E269B9F|nr:hypothetical protein [Rhodohalobacter sp. SW132]REL33837.1 hypothetical protein DYD21_10555 [Rhodohalobacter sp. SW132]
MAKLNKINSYIPTLTLWNRLEGRPRREDFDRALKAEVRDALWMVSKQWQMGEFIGDDAGSPVLAKAHMETTSLTKYKAGDAPATAIEKDIPLEVKVEHQQIPFRQGSKDIALDIRLLMGRQWLKWINRIDSDLKQEYIDNYQIVQPDSESESDAHICAHVKTWQKVTAVAGRCMDGYRFYRFLKDNPGLPSYHDIEGVGDAQKPEIDVAADKFMEWYERLYYQSHEQDKENPSWQPSYLEHQFACSAPKGEEERVLTADEYYHGHLDWYNLDLDNETTSLGDIDSSGEDPEGSITRTFIPTSVTFGGMPHPRWWTMENWKTNIGFVKPDTTDLNKLLLLDFFLVYSNDWFLVPFTLPVGSLGNVRGLTVTNSFGEKTWIEAAGSGSNEDWHRWNMYTHSIRGSEEVPADTGLSVLPVARKVLEGKPLEEVYLLRDEIANMVWGVESKIPLMTGKSKAGREAGHEIRNKLQQLTDLENSSEPTEEIGSNANIRYQVVNSVPEQWIPFIPVHKNESQREIELQRAAMPRILKNDPKIPKKIKPRTSLLREGLDQEKKIPYYIHEEEIPRAGVKIHKAFQRTRWYNGKVFNWLGIRKKTGRGEGHSGLAFDQIVPVEKKDSESEI